MRRGGGGGGFGGLGGGGFGGLGCSMATRKVLMFAFPQSASASIKEKPRLPKWTGLELDSSA